MSVLVGNKRFLRRTRRKLARGRHFAPFPRKLSRPRGIFLQPVAGRISPGVKIRLGIHVRILDRTGIQTPDLCPCRFKRIAEASLVPHGPDQDRGVIPVLQHHGTDPFQHRFLPRGIIPRQHTGVIGKSVTFNVRFIHHVKTVQVTKFIPQRCLGIVAVPHRVEVGALDQPDILFHDLTGQRTPRGMMDLVAVDPFQLDRYPVHKKLTIPDHDRPETRTEMPDIADLPAMPQNQRHRIKHRFFRRPEFKFRQSQ